MQYHPDIHSTIAITRMELLEAIRTRRTTNTRFLDKPIDEEHIRTIIEAAISGTHRPICETRMQLSGRCQREQGPSRECPRLPALGAPVATSR